MGGCRLMEISRRHFVVRVGHCLRSRGASLDRGGRRLVLARDLLVKDIVREGVGAVQLTRERRIRRFWNVSESR
jgi:hypothetical protein